LNFSSNGGEWVEGASEKSVFNRSGAQRTFHEVEHNVRAIPFPFQLLSNAMEMEDMAALKLD
jgi:hypothetical protein